MAVIQQLSGRADSRGLRQVTLRVTGSTEGYNFFVRCDVWVTEWNFRSGRVAVNRRRMQPPPYGVAYHEEQERRMEEITGAVERVVRETRRRRTTAFLRDAVLAALDGRRERVTETPLAEAMGRSAPRRCCASPGTTPQAPAT